MFVLESIVAWFVITTIINAYLMTLPKLDLIKVAYPERYQIRWKNEIKIQKKYECSGFSAAYILRHFGLEADGFDLYNKIQCKMSSGYVYPKGIRLLIKQYGLKTNYYKGNIQSLKKQISKGVPVIVFIKVQADKKYLHFVAVTGYDSEYLYLAESLEFLINCDCIYYNRKVPIKEFKKLWNIKDFRMPFYSNTYITVNGHRKTNIA